ncbi:MAG: hypothetical protein J1E00_02375 [Oscillospiraceae bacterium]|nr:hypothetical protein [Oscillospiraceae bacterium]
MRPLRFFAVLPILALCFALCLLVSCKDRESADSSAPEQSAETEEAPSATSDTSSAEPEEESSATSGAQEEGSGYLLPTKIYVYGVGGITFERRLFYNEDTVMCFYDTEVSGISHVAWEYDPTGRLLSTLHYRSDGSVLAQVDYDYDAEGRVVKVSTDYDGYQDEYERFNYDAEGNLTRSVMNYQDGKVGRITEYDADGRRVLITKNSHPDARLLCRVEILYDEHGMEVERSETDAKGNLYLREENAYQYDGDGKLVKMITDTRSTEEDGTVVEHRRESRYEYDANGQPVKVILYERNIPLVVIEATEYASFSLTEEQYLRSLALIAKEYFSPSSQQ